MLAALALAALRAATTQALGYECVDIDNSAMDVPLVFTHIDGNQSSTGTCSDFTELSQAGWSLGQVGFSASLSCFEAANYHNADANLTANEACCECGGGTNSTCWACDTVVDGDACITSDATCSAADQNGACSNGIARCKSYTSTLGTHTEGDYTCYTCSGYLDLNDQCITNYYSESVYPVGSCFRPLYYFSNGACNLGEYAAGIPRCTLTNPLKSATWEVVWGDCVVSGRCVEDGSGPTASYSQFQACTVRALQPLSIKVEHFETYGHGDFVTFDNSTRYFGDNGPAKVTMNAGDTFLWRSAASFGAVLPKGWKFCGNNTSDTLTRDNSDAPAVVTAVSLAVIGLLAAAACALQTSLRPPTAFSPIL